MSVCTANSQAAGSLGLDYFSSEVSIEGFRERTATLDSEGPGVSLGWSFNDNWSANLSYSSYDGKSTIPNVDDTLATIEADDQTRNTGLSLAYFGESAWVSLGVNQSDNDQSFVGLGRVDPFLEIDEQQRSLAVTLETGYEWAMGNWSPAVSVFLSQLSTEIEREITLDILDIFSESQTEESLSGTDAGVSASLTYYKALSERSLFAPSIALFYQTNIGGELEGETRYSYRNDRRDLNNSTSYRGNLGAPDEINGNLSLSLLTGDWIWSAGYTSVLTSSDEGDSWFLSLNYLF